MTTLLESRHISKSFDGLSILKDVSFSLNKGTIISLFGENGSGKTTLFNIVSGYVKANDGKVLYEGHDLNGKSPVAIARTGIGRVWQSPRICQNLTVEDNLILASPDQAGERALNYLIQPLQIYREERALKEKAKSIAEDINLFGKLQKTGGSLSFGQQKLLSIGMLLMNDAQLLMFDEPFAGVNAKMVHHISDVLNRLKKRGKTIFMIEHNRVKAKQISDSTLTLANGKIIQNETIAI